MLKDRKGKDNAISAGRLSENLHFIHNIKIAEVTVRELITELIENDNIMIASCNCGYFIPEKKEEVIEYAESLRGRIIEIYKRFKSIKDMLPGEYFNDIQLDMFEVRGN